MSMSNKYIRLLIKFLFWDFPRHEEEDQNIELTGYAMELHRAYRDYLFERNNER